VQVLLRKKAYNVILIDILMQLLVNLSRDSQDTSVFADISLSKNLYKIKMYFVFSEIQEIFFA